MVHWIEPTWPSAPEELGFWDGLAVTVESGVVRLWLVDTAHPWTRGLPGRNNTIGMQRVFREAKCLLFEYRTAQALPQRSQLLLSTSHVQHRGIASSPDALSSQAFETRYNSNNLKPRWHSYVHPDGYKERHLARTCRLVCRDWAKQLPLDPKLRVADGVVWRCVEDEWRVLPKRHWAWVFRGIEWWMERCQQDHAGRKSREDCKSWHLELIQPTNGTVPSEGKELFTLFSLTTTSKEYRTHLEPSLGYRFLENVRDMDGRELYRTCRLVCRDWARQFPVTDSERGKLWLREGVTWYSVEGDWRSVPREYWAWACQDMEWWAERFCPRLSGCAAMGCTCQGWYPKLLRPVDDAIRQNPEYAESTVQSLKCKALTIATASSLPPELFKYICNAADSESWSCRLVCRYWNEQCTPRVFESIDIKDSPERIRALWKVREHSMFRQYVKIVDEVPRYTMGPKFPWIHLLTQICTCTQAVWREKIGSWEARITLVGIDKRIRSIHFALPRPVPPSFPRGIRSLDLYRMTFREVEDLTHLACELPDLEVLGCNFLTFDSLPAELPRRRPRKSRNKLKQVDLADVTAAGAESKPSLVIPVLGLFLSAHDAASFFSHEEVVIFLATLSLAHPYFLDDLVCIYDLKEHARRLQFGLLDDSSCSWAYFRFNVSSADYRQNSPTLKVGISAGVVDRDSKAYLDRWANIDSILGTLHSESLEVCTQIVCGFRKREDMVQFAENILGHLPSISKYFTVQYSVFLDEDEDGRCTGCW